MSYSYIITNLLVDYEHSLDTLCQLTLVCIDTRCYRKELHKLKYWYYRDYFSNVVLVQMKTTYWNVSITQKTDFELFWSFYRRGKYSVTYSQNDHYFIAQRYLFETGRHISYSIFEEPRECVASYYSYIGLQNEQPYIIYRNLAHSHYGDTQETMQNCQDCALYRLSQYNNHV